MKRIEYLSQFLENHVGLILSTIWLTLIAFSFNYKSEDINRDIRNLAKEQIISTLERDNLYRYWAATMGGIYIDASKSHPDKYLAKIHETEILTSSGTYLRLISPAYMSKLVSNLNHKLDRIIHIVSLNPINPENIPDQWERFALSAFEDGKEKVFEFVDIDGKNYLRGMLAIKIEKVCLKCHGAQGYLEGDIKGGISFSLPFDTYAAIIRQQISSLALVHGGIFVAGLLLIFIGVRLSGRNRKKWLEDAKRRQMLMDVSPDIICFKDGKGRCLAINKPLLKLFGLGNLDYQGKNFSELARLAPFHKKIFEDWIKKDEEAWKQKGLHRQQLSIALPEGGAKTFDMIRMPAFQKSGKREGLVLIGRDITEKKQKEEALKRISQLKNLVLDLATGFINIPIDRIDDHINETLGMVGTFMNMDRAYLFEYDKKARTMNNTYEWCAEGISPHMQDLQQISMDDFPDWTNMHFRGEFIQIESVQKLPEGPLKEALEIQSIKSLITVPLMSDGICLGFVGLDSVKSETSWSPDHVSLIRMIAAIYANVLKRKEMARCIRISQNRYKELVEGLPIGLYRRTPGINGRFIMVNPAMAQMLGYDSSDQLQGQEVSAFCCELANREDCTTKLEYEGVVKDKEVQLKKRNGEIFHATISARAIYDEHGDIISIEGSVLDISERKKGEEEKQKLQAQLRQTQKIESIGRLAGGIAHDFNNLLVPILGYSELLFAALDPDDEKTRSYVRAIQDAGERAKDIVSQLLAFSRKQAIQKAPLCLNETIREFSKFLQHALREDIQISLELESGLPIIRADFRQIEQVLLNLAVNAQDAMPQGGKINIKTAKVQLNDKQILKYSLPKPGSYLTITVSDNGHGMEKHIQKQIFEPFFTTKSKDKGTGLGLATAYGIIKQHEGNIVVESKPGKGTSFKIYLPLNGHVSLANECNAQSSRITIGNENILLIEDDDEVRNFVFHTLKRCGYNVIQYSDPHLALQRCSAPHIDMLLTDVIMPNMNGHDVYLKLKRIYPDLKVLFMSGYAPDSISLECEGNFISKPFSVSSLTKAVRDVLGITTALPSSTSIQAIVA